ncbi:MAG: hypothetical protein NVS2B12_35210 [Ktedonobacteraceae bacterium]
MQPQSYPLNTGPLALLSEEEKKKRLDAMVKIWQSDTERRFGREEPDAFIASVGLNEYSYSVWLRFPEWERTVVVGQVIALSNTQRGTQKGAVGGIKEPTLFSAWRRDALLKALPDWKERLPKETVFNIAVRITSGGLGEGSKWAIVMPKEMVPRYKPGWPTQREWVEWTQSFDWLSIGIGFIRAMLDS